MSYVNSPDRASGPVRTAILQIHPSLRCNLACVHCYSGSGPTERTELDAATLCEVISDAAGMGFRVLSVAGGEPLMYRGLEPVLSHAKSLGMSTTVTTNGLFTKPEQLGRLRGLADLLAVSVDGPPEIHNKIRGSATAFQRLEAGLENVRQSGIPFGFIHTLTQPNWKHLPWVAEFAATNGARLFQIHPLELTGRATQEMTGDEPAEEVLEQAYVLVYALTERYADTMKVQLDLLDRDQLFEEPELVYAGDAHANPNEVAPAQLLSLLIVEADGTVVPVSYGFSRQYQLCNLKQQRLVDAWGPYLAGRYPAFRALCRSVWNELCEPDAPLFSNWHEIIVSRSHETGTDGQADLRNQSLLPI